MQEALWFLRLWMRQMPLLLSFVLIGFYVAENLGTRCKTYPNQLGIWAVVSVGKWGAWSLVK